MKSIIFGVIAIVLTSSLVFGRGRDSYSYDRLFKEADLVVFANALKIEVTDDKWPEQPGGFIGQNTTLNIKHTLKGAADGDQIKLLHFKYPEFSGIINGPVPVAFQIDKTEVNLGQEYLLFLKKRKDGRYEPVSGQVDPGLSIKEVSEARSNIVENEKPKSPGTLRGRGGAP